MFLGQMGQKLLTCKSHLETNLNWCGRKIASILPLWNYSSW